MRERRQHLLSPPNIPPRNSSSPLSQDKGKEELSTHTKVNTEMIPTVTRSCTEMMA